MGRFLSISGPARYRFFMPGKASKLDDEEDRKQPKGVGRNSQAV
jgi:hypothetical protein